MGSKTVRKPLDAEAQAAKDARRDAMRQAAKDMGISVTELSSAILTERELANWDKPDKDALHLRPEPKDVKARAERHDEIAEYIAVRPDKETHEIAVANWESMRNDPARQFGAKVLKALPRELNAVVVTKPGWKTAEIHRVYKAESLPPIERKVNKARIEAEAAIAAYAEAEAAKVRKTTLKRVPKAEQRECELRGAIADKASTKLRKMERKLVKATKAAKAAGMSHESIGNVDDYLKPLYMRKRIAKLSQKLERRNDVHPFPDQIKARHIPKVPFGFTSHPEAEYLRYLAERQAEALRQIAEDKAREREAEILAAIAEQNALQAIATKEKKAATWKAKAELNAEASAITRDAYLERRKMAARDRRRQAKIRNR